MFTKGYCQNQSVSRKFFLFIGIIIIGYVLSSLLSISILSLLGTTQENTVYPSPSLLKFITSISFLCVFIIPSLLGAFLFSNKPTDYLHLHPLNSDLTLLAILGFITLIPFINWTTAINANMDLPSFMSGIEAWMKSSEREAEKLTQSMLTFQSPFDLPSAIFVIAILPAIGEEFIFRSILQPFIQRNIHKTHLSVWITAFIFSTIHFQFYGFLPRLILGLYLGYLLVYTQSIWLPILIHFLNNLLAIVSEYFIQQHWIEKEKFEQLGIGETFWMSVVSLFLFLLLLSFWRKRYK